MRVKGDMMHGLTVTVLKKAVIFKTVTVSPCNGYIL